MDVIRWEVLKKLFMFLGSSAASQVYVYNLKEVRELPIVSLKHNTDID